MPAPPSPARTAALEAAAWLLHVARPVSDGLAWPVDPAQPFDPAAPNESLYSGDPGPVLFLLEAWKASGDERFLAAAKGGADHLLVAVERIDDAGLYSGLGGIGFTLAHAAKVTGDARYAAGARRAMEKIVALAKPSGAGVEWGLDQEGGAANDIVSGTAGIGLSLLWAHRALGDGSGSDPALETALRAGRRLVELGIAAEPEGRGRRWELAAGFERSYPNFSHGTAGVAYFLATLYEAPPPDRREPALLDAALAGARYLQAIATPFATSFGVGCLIHRHEPGARDLFYLSWCHGPSGTARLFERLHGITGDPEWRDWIAKLARGVLGSGAPERALPGFWNNVGQCCGNAGVAEWFLALHRKDPSAGYLAYARRMTDALLARSTVDADGRRWIVAENRTEPEAVGAQTGFMQGAAGIGLWLLRLDAFENGTAAGVTLPDSPD